MILLIVYFDKDSIEGEIIKVFLFKEE